MLSSWMPPTTSCATEINYISQNASNVSEDLFCNENKLFVTQKFGHVVSTTVLLIASLTKSCDMWIKKVYVFLFFIKMTFITKTRLFKYIDSFTSKVWNFLDKNSDIFSYFCQNIDFGYSFEPPRRGGSKAYNILFFRGKIKKIIYTPVNPSFTI